MKVELDPLFGEVPANTENLEIVGPFERRFEERAWPTVWPGSGVIRLSDHSIETETVWVDKNLANCWDFHSRWSWFPSRKRGYFFCASLFWWPGYYHWICDVLPRFHGVLERLRPDVQIILPQGMAEFHRHSLELIGVPKEQCITHAGRRPWKVQRLLYVSPVAMTGDHEPQSLFWVRGKILRACLGSSEVPLGNRRLYVTRRRAGSRRVVNENELMPVLAKYGFELIECESLNFDEQVRLFSQASVVAGAHGAGLTNVLWCGRGAKLFEIFEPGSVRRCYWSLARTLGHDYNCAVGETRNNPAGEPNLEISTEQLSASLGRVIEGSL